VTTSLFKSDTSKVACRLASQIFSALRGAFSALRGTGFSALRGAFSALRGTPSASRGAFSALRGFFFCA